MLKVGTKVRASWGKYHCGNGVILEVTPKGHYYVRGTFTGTHSRGWYCAAKDTHRLRSKRGHELAPAAGDAPDQVWPHAGDCVSDLVSRPAHYDWHPSGVSCSAITQAFSFNLGNVIKYVWRAGRKDGNPVEQDLRKAMWYLERELARLVEEGS